MTLRHRRLDALRAQASPAVERSILIADLGDVEAEAPLQPLRDDVAMAPALAGLDVCRALPAHQHRHPPLADEVAEIGGDDAGLEPIEDAVVAAQVLVRRDAVEPRSRFEARRRR